ncbi:tetratricopeptide repeat protein [Heliobacterium chlorum]|uniref:Tetratricopeptide repeat protein n=1 Tax=Heliobacterium chlorum TaxID=2698 RepID=A0ABR7T1M2_HELCL|nr:tetratricopeptide repeat protein [Heliobacterium chlorum]
MRVPSFLPVSSLLLLLSIVFVGCGATPAPSALSQAEVPSQTSAPLQDPPAQVPNSPSTSPSLSSAEGADRLSSPTSTQVQSPLKQPGEAVSAEIRQQAVDLFEKGYYIFDMEQGPNRLKDSIALYDQALKLDPDCYQAYTGKGIAVAFQGDLNSALRWLDRAIALKPNYAFAYYNKGLALKYHGHFDDALPWFDKALEYDSEHAWTYFGKASILDSQGKTQECLENLAKSIELMPYCKVTAKEKADEDFGHVKNLPEFKRLLDQ